MAASEPSAADGLGWWHDGYLWFPTLSADGRQRFDGERWEPLHPGWKVLRTVTLILLCLTPVVVLVGFGYVASEPEYPGQPEPPYATLVGLVYVLWLPLCLLLLQLATRRLGSPGFQRRGKRGRGGWAWEPPPGWPPPPASWLPSPGWRPEVSWPAAPPKWRGWTRR